jgi:hypothetical protein
MIRNHEHEMEARLSAKTLEEAFKGKVREGLGCSAFEAEAVLETVKEVFSTMAPDTVSPGQLVLLAISAREPVSKPLKDCRFLKVVLTLHAGTEDDEERRSGGTGALRRKQLVRMAHEALSQSALLTAEDLAYRIFNCGMRTITRDLLMLKGSDVVVPLRSQQKDIGRSLTHRVEAVELYLERKSYSQIKAAIHHSYSSIRNYLTTFSSVATMTRQGLSVREIAFVAQISPALVRDYQELLKRYDTPDYRERLAEIVRRTSGVVDIEEVRQAKKGGLR